MITNHVGFYYSGTTVERGALTPKTSAVFWDTDLSMWFTWNGSSWSSGARFGNVSGGNYFEIEADGTLKFVGNATIFDDQQVNLGTVGKGASAPTDIAYKGGEVLAFDAAQDNIITFIAQLSHKYKLGSTIEFHVHNTVPDNNAGDVRWVFTYSLADVGDAFPAESSIAVLQTIAANSLDDHLKFDIGNLALSGSGVSALIICSLMREGTHGDDDYGSDIYLVALDFHIECDAVGSRQELVK